MFSVCVFLSPWHVDFLDFLMSKDSDLAGRLSAFGGLKECHFERRDMVAGNFGRHDGHHIILLEF